MANWAKKLTGILIYSPDGKMSVSINSLDSKKNSLDSILFYAGDYSVQGNIIQHDVRNASALERIGKTLIRKATLKRKTLVLETVPPAFRAKLVWVRVS